MIAYDNQYNLNCTGASCGDIRYYRRCGTDLCQTVPRLDFEASEARLLTSAAISPPNTRSPLRAAAALRVPRSVGTTGRGGLQKARQTGDAFCKVQTRAPS